MPVVLFDANTAFHTRWSAQFVSADRLNRRSVPMNGALSRAQLRDVIKNAAALAGRTAGNELIFAVGHGGALQGTAAGTVDLAPAQKMRLSRSTAANIFVDPFYDFVFSHPGVTKPMSDKDQDQKWVSQNAPQKAAAQDRLARWAMYESIGSAIKTNNIYRVVLLTCNVGNAVDFVKKIALDWKVLVRAYTRFVLFSLDPKTGKSRVFLQGDQPGMGTNTSAGETQLPQVDFITVGPP